jgi:hypothetical protein
MTALLDVNGRPKGESHPVSGSQVRCVCAGTCEPRCLACIVKCAEDTGAWRERQRIAEALRRRGKPVLARLVEERSL